MVERKQIPDDTKLLIVKRIWVNKDLTVSMAKTEYGISSESNIYNWKKKFELAGTIPSPNSKAVMKAKPKKSKSTALVASTNLEEENQKLRERNEYLEGALAAASKQVLAVEDDADTLHHITMELGRSMKNGTYRGR